MCANSPVTTTLVTLLAFQVSPVQTKATSLPLLPRWSKSSWQKGYLVCESLPWLYPHQVLTFKSESRGSWKCILPHTPIPPSFCEPLEHIKLIYSNAPAENFAHWVQSLTYCTMSSSTEVPTGACSSQFYSAAALDSSILALFFGKPHCGKLVPKPKSTGPEVITVLQLQQSLFQGKKNCFRKLFTVSIVAQ